MNLPGWARLWMRDPQAQLFTVVGLGCVLALMVWLWPFLLAIAITLAFGVALLLLGRMMRRWPLLRRWVLGVFAITFLLLMLFRVPSGMMRAFMNKPPDAAADARGTK